MPQNVTTHKLVQPAGTVELVVAENAITATNTPLAIPCLGAKKIAVLFTEAGTVNNRSGALTFTVSYDNGVTYVAYNMIIDNVTNTNAQTLTRIASKTVNSASSVLLYFSPETLEGITHIKALCTITDGGSPTGNFIVKLAIAY